ncbi:aminoglycoside phosphotransferase family protein [Paenarthrobacter sp. NPDC092416]|uniref:aminoglycoside phosphotransferase family protein n=1 Tax=Paenarthrobacter sp. NPDC092416 TaxID=3364386 RepID=UPI00382DD0EC
MTAAITNKQLSLLSLWLGNYTVLHDYSWPLQDTTVLHVSTPGSGECIIKASVTSHHIRREISAYSNGLPGLEGKVPVLKHAAPDAGLLVTSYLPGVLVAGTAAETAPETYRQAGAPLATLHRPVGTSRDYAVSLAKKTHSWINRAHGLVPEDKLRRLAADLAALDPGPAQLVTTHGDYQPRNWLHEHGTVKVIDFGRAEARPWVHDLVRLSHQQLLASPGLSAAFYDGFGRGVSSDSERALWRLENLNQAIGTVVWAHQVGDPGFEQQGLGMVDRALGGFEPMDVRR